MIWEMHVERINMCFWWITILRLMLIILSYSYMLNTLTHGAEACLCNVLIMEEFIILFFYSLDYISILLFMLTSLSQLNISLNK